MTLTVKPGVRHGEVSIPASKSYAHRMLICAALSKSPSTLRCDGISKDIAATVRCLTALGARIEERDGTLEVTPIGNARDGVRDMFCGESGSTLRFMLPVTAALGFDAVFHPEGLLASRPMDALTDELEAHGAKITRDGGLICCSGKLTPGRYVIPGNISSQFISGLLFALPLLDGESTIEVTGKTESRDYIAMTESVIGGAGITAVREGNVYTVPGSQCCTTPASALVEQDWSNAAFFLCMGAMSPSGVKVREMPMDSVQGDRAIVDVLRRFGAVVEREGEGLRVRRGTLVGQTVDASEIPDLVPTICALAASAEGRTEIVKAGRLRFKESDRLATTSAMLRALGADVTETEEGIIINGKPHLDGGTVDSANDHRIAMAAAVAACACTADVTVNGAECVSKSYPDFWKHLDALEV